MNTENDPVLLNSTVNDHLEKRIRNGKRNLITNSLAISKDGKTIYYTVSSTNFVLHNGMYESLTSPSGRVLKYDVYGNISKVFILKL